MKSYFSPRHWFLLWRMHCPLGGCSGTFGGTAKIQGGQNWHLVMHGWAKDAKFHGRHGTVLPNALWHVACHV